MRWGLRDSIVSALTQGQTKHPRATMRQRRGGDGSSTRKLAYSRNRANGSVLVLLSTSNGVAAATGKSGIMISRPARAPTVAAFLDATGFLPGQQLQQRQQHQQRRQVFHTKRVRELHPACGIDSSMQSSRTHDPRRTRTLPIRPLPSSATASLLPPPPLAADEEGVDTSGSSRGSASSSNSSMSRPMAASAVDGPAAGRDELGQHRRGLVAPEQQRQRQKGQCGLSATHREERHQQHRSTPHKNSSSSSSTGTDNFSSVDDPAATTATTTAATNISSTTALSSPASSYRSRPISPQKLPNHLEHLLGRGDWRKAVATFEKSRKHQAATRGTPAADAAKKDPRALLSLGAYNQALMAYAQGRDGRSALELLREMRSAGGRLTPSRGSFNACLDACRHGGQRNKVMSVLEVMVEDGIPPSGKSYSSALQACAKEGNVADARKMLGWMWTSPDLEGGIKGLRPTTWGYNCAMEACARSGDWASALELMAEMTSNGLSHDAFTYGAALEACGRTGNWQKAEDVVTQMADAYTASLAEVSQKGSGNDSDSGAAAGPSKSTLTPTTVHCNALLQSYSRGKRVDKAVRMLEHMLMITPSGRAADAETNPPAANAKGNESSADDGDSERGESDENEVPFWWDPRLPLSRPDAISFGTVIDGCSRARMADEAVELLKVMREERIGEAPVGHAGSRGALGTAGGGGVGGSEVPVLPPNVHCVTAAITACGRAGRTEQAIGVLREAVVLEDAWLDHQTQPPQRQGDGAQEAAPVTAAAVASGLGQHNQQEGDVGEGAREVDDMSAAILKRSVEAGEKRRDAATLSVKGTEEDAKNEGEAMAVDGPGAAIPSPAVAPVPAAATTSIATATTTAPLGVRSRVPHAATNDLGGGGAPSGVLQPAYNAAINACVEAGRSAEARALINDMRERGLRPGRECFNSLLVSCSSSHEALDLLAEMVRARVAPDVASYTAAIGACSRGGDLPAALALFESMQRRPPSAGAATPATAGTASFSANDAEISSIGKSSSSKDGGGLRGIRAPPRADAQAYGAAAAACARGLDHKAAVRLLGEMRQAGLRPGRPMFGAVIDACARRGKWEEAIKLLEEMTESGVAPGLTHYSSAIFACSLGGNPTKGLELLSSMRKKRVRANSTCVNAAVHGFALLGDWKMALEILEAMEKAFQVVPDSVSYNTAMKACFRAGQNNKGLALFDRMRSYPPAPPRGLSGGGGSSDPEKSSAAKRKTRAPFPKFEVLLARDEGRQEEASVVAGTSHAVFASAGDDTSDGGGAREGFSAGAPGNAREEISAASPKTSGVGMGVSREAARGRGMGRGGRVFRASSPPRPDTASYNTVIAAVASAWGPEGRGQAMALLSEMRIRGLRPDNFTVLAVEKAGGDVD